MSASRNTTSAATTVLVLLAVAPSIPAQQPQPPAKIYNTAKLKLMEGKPLVGGTVSSPDPNMYCAMANPRPLAWKDRPGFTFFRVLAKRQLIQSGAQVLLAPRESNPFRPPPLVAAVLA